MVELLRTSAVTHLSLDHDLGDDDRGTGYAVVLWIEEAIAAQGFKPPQITVHSANASARIKVLACIEAISLLVSIDGIFKTIVLAQEPR